MARAVDTARNSRLLLGALVIVHLVAISRQVDGGGGASLLERGIFTLLSPFQSLLAGGVRGLGEAWTGYVDLRALHGENAQLNARVQTLETELQQRQAEAEQAERLRELLGLKRILPLETLTAQVVARDGLPWFRMLTLDKGRRDGVTLNAPVISSTGVVGRVVAVGPRAAKVQILLDRDSGVGATIERTRVTGLVSGQVGFADSGTTDLVMKYVSAIADVVEGDVVVTSGLDGIFPKGLTVGRVRSVGPPRGLFREVLVTPSAHFDRVDLVLVVKTLLEPAFTDESVRPQGTR